MGAPQIIVIILYSIGLILYAIADGKETDVKYSFATKLVQTAIMVALLIWGGFFK